jgi:hypothetical protein
MVDKFKHRQACKHVHMYVHRYVHTNIRTYIGTNEASLKY